MKAYDSDIIRNVAVLSHDGAGKTALVESMLLASEAVDAVGKGKENKHIMDFEPEEINRNVTIQMGIAPCEWDGYKLNFLDTPGYSEFCGEVHEALRASDGMLIVAAADSGVEVDTIRAWQYGLDMNLPRMIFVNKMDMPNADYFATLDRMRMLFGKSIMPLQIPIGTEDNFQGIIDVGNMEAWTYQDGKRVSIPIPEDYADRVQEVREQCMEAAAEGSDDLLEKYLEGEELSSEEMREGLYEGMISGRVCPVLCGSAVKHIGSDLLLDYIVHYMPDATKHTVPAVNAKTDEEVTVSHTDPFSAFVFKTMLDPFAGKLSFVRIMSGNLVEGGKLFNISREKEEKFSKMFTMIGKQQIPVTKASAGDIVVIPKLEAKTGDTFADPAFPVIYPPIELPQSLHVVAVVPEVKGEEEKLGVALNKIQEEDPTCLVRKDVESGQLLVSCMGEIHLEHLLAKMERKYGVKAKLEKPYIPYRETIRSASRAEGKHKKQSGGHGQFGHVWLDIEPLQTGESFEFVDAIVGGVVPRQYIPAVEKGVRETLEKGVIAGYPMINVKVTLNDGSYHSVDSSELAFKVAASQALKKGIPEAKPTLLEPIYRADIVVPEETMGDIMGDISSKRGRVLGMEPASTAGMTVVKAQVPMAEMLDYVTELRSMTQGRGSYTMAFHSYEDVPARMQEEIIANFTAADEEN